MNQNITVLKFGGTSLADASQFRKVCDIVRMDEKRKYVIVSAPGKRFSGDTKVTDLLIRCYNAQNEADRNAAFDVIKERYLEIESELGLSCSIGCEIDHIRGIVASGCP